MEAMERGKPQKKARSQRSNTHGLNLEGINLNGARLVETDFEFCNLRKANFAVLILHEQTFQHRSDRCNFLKCKSPGARLTGATVTRADFRGANVAGADLRQIKRGL
jgi:uncharacterized protein YjbI with pentapeptide repeats